MLDPEQQFALSKGELSVRHRVIDNVPGTHAFSPLVQRTPALDATAHAEFLYHCVATTVEHDLPEEVAYLEGYDRFATEVQHIVDLPSRMVELLHRFLRHGEGRLSRRAREKELAALTPEEVGEIERLYAECVSDSSAVYDRTPAERTAGKGSAS